MSYHHSNLLVQLLCSPQAWHLDPAQLAFWLNWAAFIGLAVVMFNHGDKFFAGLRRLFWFARHSVRWSFKVAVVMALSMVPITMLALVWLMLSIVRLPSHYAISWADVRHFMSIDFNHAQLSPFLVVMLGVLVLINLLPNLRRLRGW